MNYDLVFEFVIGPLGAGYVLWRAAAWLRASLPNYGPVGYPFPGFLRASARFCTGMPRWKFALRWPGAAWTFYRNVWTDKRGQV